MAAADFRAELSRRQDLRAAGPILGSLGKWEMEPATIHAGLDGVKCGPSPEHATEGVSQAGEHFLFSIAIWIFFISRIRQVRDFPVGA